MTWSIIERKADEFKTSGVAIAVAVAVVAFVFRTFSSISSVTLSLTWLYHLHHSCKLLRMTWSIVERKTDEFKMSEIAIAVAVTMIAFVSRTFSSISSVTLLLTWLYHLYHGCKLLIMTCSIIERKTDEFKTSGVAVAVAVAVVAFVFRIFSSISTG